jgi:hypothetical protein
MTCLLPENQLIYDILLQEAKYLSHNYYDYNNHLHAAKLVKNFNKNIYCNFDKISPMMTDDIVYYIRSIIPRRSPRLANKPKVQYYTKHDELNDVIISIEDVCIKKSYTYEDSLIDDFYEWLTIDSEKYDWITTKYDYKNKKVLPCTIPEIAKNWTLYLSNNIRNQKYDKSLLRALKNYCIKNGFEYNPLMNEKFIEWMYNPENIVCISFISDWGQMYFRSPSWCVKKWFSTLKKIVVF